MAFIAAGVSLLGAASAKRSAHADEQMLQDQRTPEFDALVEDQNGNNTGLGGTPLLMLQLVAPQTLDSVEVELLTPGTLFTAGQYGVEAGASRRSATLANSMGRLPMAVGTETRWRIAFPEPEVDPDDGPDPAGSLPPVDTVQLVVHAAAGKARWDVLVNAPVDAVRKNRRYRAQWAELHKQMYGKRER
ncbi:hypothetical protein ACFYMB_20140 [Micromonospora haikouensis]|uniref:hypothetical protein n=1 Tax=Micromonospora haikouensis TaxID=686309 RepID=UPI0036B32D5D